MIPSLSEIQSTSRKACRGAGFSWGLADEAGRAAAWLWAHGVDSPSALAALLSAHQNAICTPSSCPLHLGTRICDTVQSGPIAIDAVQNPILLLSFVAELAKLTETSQKLCFGKAVYYADETGMFCESEDTPNVADVLITPAAANGARMTPAARRAVSPQAWSTLASFEHKTYAPATQASRLAGAGAGLSDND